MFAKDHPEALVMTRAQVPLGVMGKPYEARFESIAILNAAVTDRAQGALYRDSQGRVRIEHKSSAEAMTVIYDPIAEITTLLDDIARVAQQVRQERRAWAFADSLPVYKDDYEVIHGVRCRRILLKHPTDRKDFGETWLSEEFGIVMRERDTARCGELEWRISEIQFREPPLTLFQLPTGYRFLAPEGE
jgi:hypothetical protein